VRKVLSEERYHREHAGNWLERLTAGAEGRERVQSAADRLFPHALALFEPVGESDADVDALGLRTESLDSMREQWLDTVLPFLSSLGIDAAPELCEGTDVEWLLPESVGVRPVAADALGQQ
jgi:ring-1,2-phenylacetyl-CoA epoxidase subunit PaaC